MVVSATSLKKEGNGCGRGPFISCLAPLLLLTGLFFLNFLARIAAAPLMPAIEGDLGFGHGEAGAFFLMVSAGYCVGLLFSGFVSCRLSHNRTIGLSALIVGIFLFLASRASNTSLLRIAMIMAGIGAGLYLPSGIATITEIVEPGHWGKAIAIHELAPNLGLVTAPLISELLLDFISWRGIFALIGAASIAAALVFICFGRGRGLRGEAPGPRVLKSLVRHPPFWIMIAFFSLGIGASLGIYTMLPLFLVSEHGLELGFANTMIGLSRISGLGMALVAGWATDRLGPRRALKWVFLATGSMTILLGLVPGKWILPFVFLQPATAVCFFPPGFSAISRVNPSDLRNVAVSLTVPLAFLAGAGLIPAAVGVLAEAGAFSLAIQLVGVLILCGIVPLRLLGPEG